MHSHQELDVQTLIEEGGVIKDILEPIGSFLYLESLKSLRSTHRFFSQLPALIQSPS